MGYEAAKALANTAISHGQEGKAFTALEIFTTARAHMVGEQNHVWPSLIHSIRLFSWSMRAACRGRRRASWPSPSSNGQARRRGPRCASCCWLASRFASRMRRTRGDVRERPGNRRKARVRS